MQIDFGSGLTGYQNALRLRLVLDFYERNHSADSLPAEYITPLRNQIDQYLNQPEFEQFRRNRTLQAGGDPEATQLGWVSGLWRGLLGPSQRELELSQQRRNLIERAEHAEQMAFEALAETAEVGRQRDQTRQRIKELEAELEALRGRGADS